MLLLASLLGASLAGAPPAAPAPVWQRVAPGVEYRWFDVPSSRGTARAHLLSVDLGNARVSAGLLYPGVVAARSPLSTLADGAGAVGGVNGDFFHLSENQHPGVEATGAPVGPAVADGRPLKAAVPNGQRFGPALPPGTNTRQVLGIGEDGLARVGELVLDGTVSSPEGELELGGLNQYALPVDSVGVFTKDWGAASRVRATCGTDTRRDAPCSSETYEVTVRGGQVVAVAETPGRGAIAPGTEVLVGREAGARELRRMAVGDHVNVTYALVADGQVAERGAYRFAVGGYPVLRGGEPLSGMDRVTPAVRTAAGVGEGGRRLLLLALDGGPGFRTGLTVVEVADALRDLGASDAVNLDGGGSSTLVARKNGAAKVSVLNHPSGGAQRAVPNGIGVFVRGEDAPQGRGQAQGLRLLTTSAVAETPL
ncbi:phosphodiester glycosidase family protein [Streptomyces sp. WAC05374]|uniref:phosphodiester glycosidase family protein n=1 Tax=Streptomyces sp. WAC05374 TaxID=2487420 RepID=UPI0010555E41|nr:phosphodiester glycosidase family protein [Streptomyces sp. WAC05374]TDF47922.1 phosphodiester glycosidase family protein [Streptomyces sp. WAC05374]TDF54240.1 phosphodiester glycosidase family protein [Streptomyces sp. WAC05374]